MHAFHCTICTVLGLRARWECAQVKITVCGKSCANNHRNNGRTRSESLKVTPSSNCLAMFHSRFITCTAPRYSICIVGALIPSASWALHYYLHKHFKVASESCYHLPCALSMYPMARRQQTRTQTSQNANTNVTYSLSFYLTTLACGRLTLWSFSAFQAQNLW